jgi:Arc/MetJ-type ribon-helix-helix transcriptional regulator
MTQDEYRTVKLPADLYGEVEGIVNEKGSRYVSVSEFVKESIRLKLESLERLEAGKVPA